MAGTSILPFAASEVVMKYKEPFLTKGINEKLAVNTPPGVYRGFRLATNALALHIQLNPEAATADHSAVYEDRNHVSLTIRKRAVIVLNLTPFAGKTVVLAIFSRYTLGIDTYSEIRAYELSPTDEFTTAVEKSELVVLGTIVVPASGLIPAANISYDRRTSAWQNIAPEAVSWSPLMRNGGVEWGKTGAGEGRFAAAFWDAENTFIGAGAASWNVATTNPHSGTRHFEFNVTVAPTDISSSVSQFIDVPVTPGQLLRVRGFKRMIQTAAGGALACVIDFTDGVNGSPSAPVVIFLGTTVNATYEEFDHVVQVPAGAAHLHRVRMATSSIDFGAVGPAIRFDDLQVWLETNALNNDIGEERRGAAILNHLVMRERDGTMDSPETMFTFDKDFPVGEGTLEMGRRDQKTGSANPQPDLSVLGRIRKLGNEMIYSAGQADAPRIGSIIAGGGIAQYTLLWEWTEPGGSASPTRFYASARTTEQGGLTVVINALWSSATSTWTKDDVGQSALKFALGRGTGLVYAYRDAATAGSWADTAWTFDELHMPVGTAAAGTTSQLLHFLRMGHGAGSFSATGASTPKLTVVRSPQAAGITKSSLILFPTALLEPIGAGNYLAGIWKGKPNATGVESLEIVLNAIFVNSLSEWLQVNPTSRSMRIYTDHKTFSLDTRVAGSAPWADVSWVERLIFKLDTGLMTLLPDSEGIFFDVTGANANPAPTLGLPNRLVAKNITKCWGTVASVGDGSGNAIVYDGFNVQNASISGGKLVIGFATPMANDNYGVTANMNSNTLGEFCQPFTTNSSSFTITTVVSTTGAALDLDNNSRVIMFSVDGQQDT